MRSTIALASMFFSACALAQGPPAGKRVFERFCAECHAPGFGHPGTQRLEQTRGKALSVLEARSDLVPVYVTAVVRNGLVEMPAYRPSEIDDTALQALVVYLTSRASDQK